jgi:peptide deformylase
MAPRKIITVPNETLKRKARKVTSFGPELQTLIDDMVETMRVAPGVGLAAPQIDVPLRVIVIEYGEVPEDKEDDVDYEVVPDLYTIVNPEIKKPSSETLLGIEGCLSIPGIVAEVERAESVTVVGQTRHGQEMKLKVSGWLARIFQHEVDHLDGVLFTDKAVRVFRLDEEGEIVE